jgi:PII-like signaling protein
MTVPTLNGNHTLLRVYFDEYDRVQHHSVYDFVLARARELGLAGCTVLRARAGFGGKGILRNEFWFEGVGDFPILIESVDRAEKILDLRKAIDAAIPGTMLTEESVTVRHYGHLRQDRPDSVATRRMESMEHRTMQGAHSLLRIFFGESDRAKHEPLFIWILNRARKNGLAGCTVIRGLAGFGASSIVHESHLFKLSNDLPIIVEVIDTAERVQSFLAEVEPWLEGALVTEEDVHVHHYSKGTKLDERKAS